MSRRLSIVIVVLDHPRQRLSRKFQFTSFQFQKQFHLFSPSPPLETKKLTYTRIRYHKLQLNVFLYLRRHSHGGRRIDESLNDAPGSFTIAIPFLLSPVLLFPPPRSVLSLRDIREAQSYLIVSYSTGLGTHSPERILPCSIRSREYLGVTFQRLINSIRLLKFPSYIWQAALDFPEF